MNLSGKVALITGAAQGLGKAFTEHLLSKGAKVCMTDVQAETGQVTLQAFQSRFGADNAFFTRCDVTSPDEFSSTFSAAKSKYGRLDIVVNNAGILNEQHWRKAIDINLVGMMQGTQLGIEHMSKAKGGDGGVIINVSSLAGLLPIFFMPAYSASKHGIVGYTRSWAQNPSNDANGLRFCCLCPAFADTAMLTMTEDSTLSMDHAHKLEELLGVCDVETVAKGFLELVTDETNNGAVMSISAREGVQYKFQPDKSASK